MSLETPDRLSASCVLLFQNMLTPGEETVEFRNNIGFQSVAFLDVDEVEDGIVMTLTRKISNDEGSVFVQGDGNVIIVSGATGALITPPAVQLPDAPLVDALPPFQVAIWGMFPVERAYRVSVQVWRVNTDVEPIPGEPLPLSV